jgi:hypothetical protein
MVKRSEAMLQVHLQPDKVLYHSKLLIHFNLSYIAQVLAFIVFWEQD